MTEIRIICRPYFGDAERRELSAPVGETLAECVARALPDAPPDASLSVSIGDKFYPREEWDFINPVAGDSVGVVVMPKNGGLLRSVATGLATVGAIAFGQLWAVPLLGTFTGGLVTLAGVYGANLLLNALIPARRDTGAVGIAPSPTYSIQGFRNQVNPDGVVPCVYGRVRFAPPYAVRPYTYAAGGRLFTRAVFCAGVGPVKIRNIRLGDTPIEAFGSAIRVNVREGLAGDAPLEFVVDQPLQQPLTIDLARKMSDVYGVSRRWTASDVSRVSIAITFRAGLYAVQSVAVSDKEKKSVPVPMQAIFRIYAKKEGAASEIIVADWAITDLTTEERAYQYDWTPPERGRWEIGVLRLTPDLDDVNAISTDVQFFSRAHWTALNSYRPEYPINAPYKTALIEIDAVGTGILNGVVDDLNCEVTRIALDYDAETETWIERETKNPAAAMRFALQGPVSREPTPDDEINLARLAEFAINCADNSLEYNRVHDFEATPDEALHDICAAGRAAPRHDGERWDIVIDRPATMAPVMMTARNSWGFSVERAYRTPLHAFRVKFYDETNSYKPAERVIPFPGFEGTPTLIEEIEMPGVTSPDAIWIETRKRQYELQYRPDLFRVTQAYEGALAVRGDLVLLNYDVLDPSHVSARVEDVAGRVVALDEEIEMRAGEIYGVQWRRLGAAEDGSQDIVYRRVITAPGRRRAVTLDGPGPVPETGSLIAFGRASVAPTERCIVLDVEGGDDFTRHFRLVAEAANIFDLLADEVPPPWNGRYGAPVDLFAPSLDFSRAENSQYDLDGWV